MNRSTSKDGEAGLGPQSSRCGQSAGRAPPAPQLDADARCVAAVVAGERERFSELVERYQDAVAAVVRGYVRDPHAAEDVAQDVFLKAFSALGQLREPRLFFPWLLQIARHCTSQTAQRAEQRQNLRPLTGEEPVAAPGARAEDRLTAVLRRLEELPEPYRETVILKYQRALGCKEIATLQGVAVGTVTSRLTRALAMLREALRERKAEP